MIKIALPDGSIKEIEFDFKDKDGNYSARSVFWHTGSHILAQAVKKLYPNARLAIGPAVDNGFYYDFDVEKPFSPEDLTDIEKEMSKIIKANHKIKRFILPKNEALEFMRDEPYKLELIRELPENEEISFYEQGEGEHKFTDLCAGPHLVSTGQLKAFKLTSTAGAYWRGSEKNKMLARIYGVAYPKKEELEEYLTRLEEAKKRDHRKLGRELDLFDLYEEGPGFPFFTPRGMILRNLLEDFWRSEHKKYGYQEIKTPIILNEDLWHRSGHWEHYKENMYFTKIDENDYAVKPMNCPGGMLLFKRRMHSYRDLPQRLAELGLVHRHELSGTLHGLMRVRCFTQDDAHIFMTADQVKDEIKSVIDLIENFYKVFGFGYKIELATRPEKFMGTEEQWEIAEGALKEALEELGIEYKINEGDGAFYGPKIDFQLRDSIGRTWQCGTIQLDFQMPERFDLSYVGQDNQKHRPIMIHRAIFGSLERFIAILIEHFAGAFPVWLAPVQTVVLPIGTSQHDFAYDFTKKLQESGIRAEVDDRNEKIGYKIREHQTQKVPYMLIIGDKEIAAGEVSVRSYKKGELGAVKTEEFIKSVTEEIKNKT
ncbi:MAG: threonine--tRNA ligase [Oscillospiraceae bacterium]|nr:threonine--tRNA ligase [Oscillospiraceae bacterium]